MMGEMGRLANGVKPYLLDPPEAGGCNLQTSRIWVASAAALVEIIHVLGRAHHVMVGDRLAIACCGALAHWMQPSRLFLSHLSPAVIDPLCMSYRKLGTTNVHPVPAARRPHP
jgi:hypothetical protein